jgi:hypothetical protein
MAHTKYPQTLNKDDVTLSRLGPRRPASRNPCLAFGGNGEILR